MAITFTNVVCEHAIWTSPNERWSLIQWRDVTYRESGMTLRDNKNHVAATVTLDRYITNTATVAGYAPRYVRDAMARRLLVDSVTIA